MITGASVPCCQGSNPQPLASAICGHYFNIAPDVTNAAYNAAICGKYNMACECYRNFYWPLKRNVLLRSITSLITDCVAPYNIDVIFDALSDKGGAASNDITSCGKWNSLDNLLFNENLNVDQ